MHKTRKRGSRIKKKNLGNVILLWSLNLIKSWKWDNTIHVGEAWISWNVISVYCSQVFAQLIPNDISLSFSHVINGYYSSKCACCRILNMKRNAWDADPAGRWGHFFVRCIATLPKHNADWHKAKEKSLICAFQVCHTAQSINRSEVLQLHIWRHLTKKGQCQKKTGDSPETDGADYIRVKCSNYNVLWGTRMAALANWS